MPGVMAGLAGACAAAAANTDHYGMCTNDTQHPMTVFGFIAIICKEVIRYAQ